MLSNRNQPTSSWANSFTASGKGNQKQIAKTHFLKANEGAAQSKNFCTPAFKILIYSFLHTALLAIFYDLHDNYRKNIDTDTNPGYWQQAFLYSIAAFLMVSIFDSWAYNVKPEINNCLSRLNNSRFFKQTNHTRTLIALDQDQEANPEFCLNNLD